jgi:uncharacterized RDD family membrane protein YckC
MEKAGFVQRLVAYLIDGFALGIIATILSLVISPIVGLAGGTDSGMMAALAGGVTLLLIIILLLLQFFYFGYFWSKSGQSIGMKLMNIKVVRIEGGLLSFLSAGLRGTLGYWLSGAIFWLGYIWILIDADKQGWHDKIFGTYVVRA